MLLERRPPRDQAEAEPIIDHGEPAAGKLSRTDQPTANMVAGNGRPPFPAPLGGERPAGALDVAGLKPLNEIFGGSDPAITKVSGIALVGQPTPALGQRRRHFPAESVVRQDGALT